MTAAAKLDRICAQCAEQGCDHASATTSSHVSRNIQMIQNQDDNGGPKDMVFILGHEKKGSQGQRRWEVRHSYSEVPFVFAIRWYLPQGTCSIEYTSLRVVPETQCLPGPRTQMLRQHELGYDIGLVESPCSGDQFSLCVRQDELADQVAHSLSCHGSLVRLALE